MNTGSSSNLETATRDLLTAWARAQESWRDQQSRHFEKTYLEPLPELVTQARDALSHLEGILRKIKHDCQ